MAKQKIIKKGKKKKADDEKKRKNTSKITSKLKQEGKLLEKYSRKR